MDLSGFFTCRFSKIIFPLLILLYAQGKNPLDAQVFVEAENYSAMSGIQVETTSDEGGGENVGWIDAFDWMEYSIYIPVSGEYIMRFRTASLSDGGRITIRIENIIAGSQDIPVSGGWQNWETVQTDSFTFEEGNQLVKLTATKSGFNLNWFELVLVNPEDTIIPSSPQIVKQSGDVHSIFLSWKSSVDTGSAVTGYKLFNDNTYLAFSEDTSFQLTKLPPETNFELAVHACDAAGNLSLPATVSVSTTPINWNLSWSDEFEGNEVDRTKWNFQVGGGGWGNGEAQYYTNGANSTVADGYLTIEARKENYGGNQFTSSRMNNANKGDFLFGRVEVRAKLPSTGGTWPAIWTLPTEWVYGGWPDCGEIDIMEHTGNNLGHVFGTIHTGAYNHQDGTQRGGGVYFSDVADSFHVYALEWYPDHLDWYYDDQLVFSFDNEYNTFAEWPYDIKHHLLLNVAVGGGLGGNINYNGVWPQQMVVDYVRIYDFDLGSGDTIPPGAPGDLKAQVSGISVELSWESSSDDGFIEYYYIYKNSELIDSVSGTNYNVRYLQPLTEYLFSIQASDFGGNTSEMVSVSVSTQDIESIALPGIIQAENFIYMEGIQTETCTDVGGGRNIGYLDPGDWLQYYVDVDSSGPYYLWVRAAAQSLTGSFQLIDENDNVLTTVQTPATGGWQNWETVISGSFQLNKGKQFLTLKSLAREFNINWLEVSRDSASAVHTTEDNPVPDMRLYPNPMQDNHLFIDMGQETDLAILTIYSMEGQEVFRKTFNGMGQQLVVEGLKLNPGVFIVQVEWDGSRKFLKLLSR